MAAPSDVWRLQTSLAVKRQYVDIIEIYTCRCEYLRELKLQ